jgi:hypothetical protein
MSIASRLARADVEIRRSLLVLVVRGASLRALVVALRVDFGPLPALLTAHMVIV